VSSPSSLERIDRAGALYRWYVVGLLGLIYFVAFADRLVLSLLVEPIKHDLGASDAQVGLLFGLAFAATLVVVSLPLARLADRTNRRNLVAAAVALWSLTTAAAGLAPTFGALLACRVGLAVGEAGLTPAALSMISDLFPKRTRARPVAVYLTAGVAGATGSLIVVALALRWATRLVGAGGLPLIGALAPWRLTLIMVGLPTTALALLLWATVREPAREPDDGAHDSVWAGLRYLRQNVRQDAGFYVAGALMALLGVSASAWYPSLLIRDRGLSASTAGYLFGAVSIVAGVSGSMAAPWFGQMAARRWPDGLRRTALAAVSVGATAYAVGASLRPSLATSLAAMGLASFCFIGGINIPAIAIQQSAPPRLRAQLASLYFLGVNLGGLGTGPLLTALVARAFFGGEHGLGPAMVAMAVCAGPLAILALLALSRAPPGDASDLPGLPAGRAG
jgi:MFS family permease